MIDPKIDALRTIYKGRVKRRKVEVQNYLDNIVAVGDHGSFLDTMDELITDLAQAEEKLFILEKYFSEEPQ